MKERLPYLLNGWIQKKLTEEEESEWNRLLMDESLNEDFKDILDEVWFSKDLNDRMKEQAAEEIFNRITSPKVIAIRRKTKWIRWVAAAVILLIVCSLWLVVNRKPTVDSRLSTVVKTNNIAAPTNSRAVITLADGSMVYLDNAANGTLAQQNHVKLLKSADGKIIYLPDHQIPPSQTVYNTLTNPRGSKVIDMQLSDGSHVWLNAGSSVKYPVAFTGNDRTVEISGEAYFEVMHDARKPFHVKKGETDITVLGTHFNVNAYDDEDALRVTLLEGSVKVSSLNNAKVLKPGQQAKTMNGTLSVVNDVDMDEVMAWKNGLFSFHDANIQTVMRQLARWYNIEVSYEGTNKEIFSGKIARNLNLGDLLDGLGQTRVHYRIEENKKLIIMP